MKHLLYIGNNLNNRRSNPSVMNTLGPLLETEGYKVTYASAKQNRLFRLWDMLWHVLKYSKRVDFVMIDTYSTQNFYYALLVSQLCRFLQLKYVSILHGGNLPNRLKSHPKLCQLIFHNASYNVCPSGYLKNAFEAEGYHNLMYVPNPISIKQYPLTTRTFEVPRLLWVRSFAFLYNPMLAVKVLKILRDKGFDAQLCMVGPDRDETLSKVKHLAAELKVDVRFTGKLSKLEWTALAKDYNVFINTANVDNTPISVIEAMAMGLPIVSTNVGGMAYLMHHNTDGFLVPPDDANAMAEQILQLFDKPAMRALLIANARAKVQKFDWEVVRLRWKTILIGER